MVNNTGVLHEIQTVSLFLPLFIKVSLNNISNQTSLDPRRRIVLVDIDILILDHFIVFFIELNFLSNSLNPDHSLFVHIEVLGVLHTLGIDLGDDLLDDVIHSEGLELLGVVNTHLHEAGLGHGDDHSYEQKGENAGFY